jgi:hypothetical protein
MNTKTKSAEERRRNICGFLVCSALLESLLRCNQNAEDIFVERGGMFRMSLENFETFLSYSFYNGNF